MTKFDIFKSKVSGCMIGAIMFDSSVTRIWGKDAMFDLLGIGLTAMLVIITMIFIHIYVTPWIDKRAMRKANADRINLESDE